MQDAVTDAILLEHSDDPVLTLLILVAKRYLEGVPTFTSQLKAPAFFLQHFVPWVKDGLQALEATRGIDGGGVPPAPSV